MDTTGQLFESFEQLQPPTTKKSAQQVVITQLDTPKRFFGKRLEKSHDFTVQGNISQTPHQGTHIKINSILKSNDLLKQQIYLRNHINREGLETNIEKRYSKSRNQDRSQQKSKTMVSNKRSSSNQLKHRINKKLPSLGLNTHHDLLVNSHNWKASPVNSSVVVDNQSMFYKSSKRQPISQSGNYIELEKKMKRYHKMQQLLEKYKSERIEAEMKQTLIMETKKNYPEIKFSYASLKFSTYQEIEKQVQLKIQIRRSHRAAIKLQTHFRMWIQRKKYRELQKRRQESAIKIQRVWKFNRWYRVIKNVTFEKRQKAAIKIQSYYRGYQVRSKYMKPLLYLKIQNTERYLRSKRIEMLEDAQILIRYHWFKYLNNKRKQVNNIVPVAKKIQKKMDHASARGYKAGPSNGYPGLIRKKTTIK